MPQPKHPTLAESRVVVNDLLLYWIQHGRITVVPGIGRFDGSTVTFIDGTQRAYDTILWAADSTPTKSAPGRFDIVRAIWNEQLADTERLLNAFQAAQHASSAPLLT